MPQTDEDKGADAATDHPFVVAEERLQRGIVLDNRSQFVMGEVDDVLDRLVVETRQAAHDLHRSNTLTPTAALALWHRQIAIDDLRMRLSKTLRTGPVRVGRR